MKKKANIKTTIMAQIATTIEQSKKFKGLGIDVDSADMSWHFTNMRTESLQWELKTVPLVTKENFFGKIEKLASPFYKHADGSPMTGDEVFDKIWGKDLPAWSLGALIKLMPDTIILDNGDVCGLSVLNIGVYYRCFVDRSIVQGFENDNIFDNCVNMIEWAVRNEHIKK
ncbi:hypothetical protein [Prevotella intermedia]|nr:hypothetical protein [Prevotella intermedia]